MAIKKKQRQQHRYIGASSAPKNPSSPYTKKGVRKIPSTVQRRISPHSTAAGAMRSLMAKSLFFPSVALNIVLERLSLFSWYTRIDEHVVLGAIPFRGEFSDQVRLPPFRRIF